MSGHAERREFHFRRHLAAESVLPCRLGSSVSVLSSDLAVALLAVLIAPNFRASEPNPADVPAAYLVPLYEPPTAMMDGSDVETG